MSHETDQERVKSALSFLDYNDEDVWIDAAMGLKSEFGDDGFDIWEAWGSQYERYNAKEARGRWKSIKAGGGKTIASLFYDAKAAGWKDDKKYEKPSREEIERRKAAAAKRQAEAEAQDAEVRAAAAKHAQFMWEKARPIDGDEHPYLSRKGVVSHGLRVGVWEKLDHENGEVITISEEALLVPIRDAKKTIHSLQAIFPTRIMSGRDKDFVTDGAISGNFYSFGKPQTADVQGQTRQVILVGEGYATLASAHAATGHACIVAFHAGNLPKVAQVLRERFPDAALVFLADNDRATEGNPGVKKARQAADEVGGLVAIPEFGPEHADATDFNDLHMLRGLDAVRQVIEAALNPAPPTALPEQPEPLPWEDGPDNAEADDEPPMDDDDDDGSEGPAERNGHFAVLGYNRGSYYIFHFGQKQIREISKSELGDSGLIDLAPLNWWEANFPGERAKIDTKMAMNAIVRQAERRGIFDTRNVRGRGAWVDDGRMVYHHGSHLTVDGKTTDVTRIPSRYVYEMKESLQAPADAPLTDEEGRRMIDIARLFRWSVEGSALLFAGWIALAPICGAIPWRPHLWLTGGAGSGKSSLAKFAHDLLKGTDVFAQGSSSESGIRQRLQSDALPVLMDESESNEEGDIRRIQNVLSLIRQASTDSDAETLKGTTDGRGMTFHIRSMFCLASIQVGMKHQADVDRLTVLTLRSGKNAGPDASKDWQSIKDRMYSFVGRNDETRARLLRRSIDLLPVTLKNIEVFSSAGADYFGSQRDGDQFGALLAGAWSLMSSEVATKEQAIELFGRHSYRDLREDNDADESQRALMALMGSHVRVKGGVELTVYELVSAAAGRDAGVAEISSATADAILLRYGMKVKSSEWLVLANGSKEINNLMQHSTFEADWRGVLLRLEGADKNGNKPERFSGVMTKCIRLPLRQILSAEEKAF